MTVRDELLEVAAETACVSDQAREAVLELRRAAEQMAAKPPANEIAIRQVATAFKIPVRHRQVGRVVANLTDVLLDEVANPGLAPSRTIRVFAPERDLREWERHGAIPHGAYHEAARAVRLAHEAGGDVAAGAEGERAGADALARQLARCKLALAYPAGQTLHIARAILAGEPVFRTR